MPVWEPGGGNVTYLSNRNGNFDAWSKPADGTGEPELLLYLDADLSKIDWAPDGAWLLLQTSQNDILGYRSGVDGEPTPLLAEEYADVDPAVSPDGRWIAYASDETGRYEVYVRPFPNVSAGRWQVSSQGGRLPRWAHNGRELYFDGLGQDTPIWVVAVEAAASFAFEDPVVLFTSAGWSGSIQTGSPYDVAPDDERFLVARTGPASDGDDDGVVGPATVLVNNFFEELRRLVP